MGKARLSLQRVSPLIALYHSDCSKTKSHHEKSHDRRITLKRISFFSHTQVQSLEENTKEKSPVSISPSSKNFCCSATIRSSKRVGAHAPSRAVIWEIWLLYEDKRLDKLQEDAFDCLIQCYLHEWSQANFHFHLELVMQSLYICFFAEISLSILVSEHRLGVCSISVRIKIVKQ